jgi:hypothetical protein
MTTAIYPALDNRASALSYYPEGEKERQGHSKAISSRQDLLDIAGQSGIPRQEANEIIDHISQAVLDNAVEIARNPPEIFRNHPACLHALKCIATEIVLKSDAPKPSDWTDEEDVWSWEYEEATAKTVTLAFNGLPTKMTNTQPPAEAAKIIASGPQNPAI